MLLTWLSQYRDIGLLLLRVGIGVMMTLHGWPKLAGGLEKWEHIGLAMSHLGIHFFPGFWGFLCAMVETLGGVLLVLGAAFRPVAILFAGNFLVATVMVFKTSRGEFLDWSRPAEMLILFVALVLIGAGKYSIDRS
jgi:putative oxidoreductase